MFSVGPNFLSKKPRDGWQAGNDETKREFDLRGVINIEVAEIFESVVRKRVRQCCSAVKTKSIQNSEKRG